MWGVEGFDGFERFERFERFEGFEGTVISLMPVSVFPLSDMLSQELLRRNGLRVKLGHSSIGVMQ